MTAEARPAVSFSPARSVTLAPARSSFRVVTLSPQNFGSRVEGPRPSTVKPNFKDTISLTSPSHLPSVGGKLLGNSNERGVGSQRFSVDQRYPGNLKGTVKLSNPIQRPITEGPAKLEGGLRWKTIAKGFPTQPTVKNEAKHDTFEQKRVAPQVKEKDSLSERDPFKGKVLKEITLSRVENLNIVFLKTVIKPQTLMSRREVARGLNVINLEAVKAARIFPEVISKREVPQPVARIMEFPKRMQKVTSQPRENLQPPKAELQQARITRVIGVIKELEKLNNVLNLHQSKAQTEVQAVAQVQTQVDQAAATYQVLVKAGVKADQARVVVKEALSISTASKPRMEVLTRTFDKTLESQVKVGQLVDQKEKEEEEKKEIEIFLNVDEEAYEVRSEVLKFAITEAFKKARAEGRTTVNGSEITAFLPKEPTKLKIRSQILGQYSIFKWIFDGSWTNARFQMNQQGVFESEEEALQVAWQIHNNNRPVEVDFRKKKSATEQERQKVIGAA